jgi:ribosome-associated protein
MAKQVKKKASATKSSRTNNSGASAIKAKAGNGKSSSSKQGASVSSAKKRSEAQARLFKAGTSKASTGKAPAKRALKNAQASAKTGVKPNAKQAASKATKATAKIVVKASAKSPVKSQAKSQAKGPARSVAKKKKSKALSHLPNALVPGATQDASARPAFVEHAEPTMPALASATPSRQRTASDVERSSDDALPADAKLAFAIEAARLVKDDNCDDVVVLDVRGSSHLSDYIVIGSGTSDRQMRSVLEHVEKLGDQRNFRAFHSSRDDRATWLLVDFVDVVVHLFEPSQRARYDLEMLWGDSPRIEWERSDQRVRDRAGVGTK